ncbi:MAG: hypothetical protein AAF730_11835 [Bacteroidota bacterium]
MKHNEKNDMRMRPNTPKQASFELEGWVEEPFPTSNLRGFGASAPMPERKMPVWASLAVWCGEID